MDTNLSHLPEQKRQELQLAAEIIQDELNLDMLILFGSYARGDWVEEFDTETLLPKYQSDFDLLVVTELPYQAMKIESNSQLKRRLIKEVHRTPISLIAEDINFINKRLRKSQYFYIDILKQGKMLFDSAKFQLAEPREITLKERKNLAVKDFEYWFNCAIEFLEGVEFYTSKNRLNKAVFLLHQAVECLYGTILLVFTRYKPNTHDLEKLGSRVASIETQFLKNFPQGTEAEQKCFDLLRKAYVSARYNPCYTITLEELTWLAQRVEELKNLTEQRCKDKIESFSQGID